MSYCIMFSSCKQGCHSDQFFGVVYSLFGSYLFIFKLMVFAVPISFLHASF